MSATFRVQLEGQTVPLRFQTVSFAGIREIVEADLTVDINSRAVRDGSNVSDANAEAFKSAIGLTSRTGIGDGTGNDPARLVSTSASEAGKPILIDGSVEITLATDAVITADEVRLVGEPGATLTNTGGRVHILPGSSALPNLAADITPTTTTVTFATAHGLAEGDVFKVYNPTDYSQSLHRAEYRAGRFFKVATVPTSTTVTIYGGTPRTLAAADVTVSKVLGKGAAVEGLTIDPGSTDIPVWITGHSPVSVKNNDVLKGTNGTGIEIYDCYDVSLDGNRGRISKAGSGYLIALAGCQKVSVTGSLGQNSNRHVTHIGGRNGGVPTSDVLLSGLILENERAGGISAADMHGGTENITYQNCIIYMAQVAGRNAAVLNSTIYSRTQDNLALLGSEIDGGVHRIIGNRFIPTGPNDADYGVMTFPLNKLSEPLDIIIDGNDIDYRGADPAVSAALVLQAGSVVGDMPGYQVRVFIKNLRHNAALIGSLFRITGTNDVSAWVSVYVDDLEGAYTNIMTASNSANYACLKRAPVVGRGITTRGDAAATLSTLTDTHTQIWNTDLTANRTVTLSTGLNLSGKAQRFTIVRTGGGAFNLVLGTTGQNLLKNQGALVEFDGAAWQVLSRWSTSIGAGVTVSGNVNATLTAGTSLPVQIWNVALTTGRTATLSTTGAYDGATFTVVRDAASTGASLLNVGTGPLAALKPGQWARVTYSASLGAWTLTGRGALAPETGWSADTGTSKKTASATYTAGAAITAPTGGATQDSESRTAIGTLITRLALVEAALQNCTQGQKAVKDALLVAGTISA